MEKPELSVILPTDTYQTIQPVLERLRQQDKSRVIEIVLVTTALDTFPESKDLEAPFMAVQIIKISKLSPLGEARLAGIRAATAPLVFIGETHSYPQTGWASKLLAAAESGPWTAVAPGVDNANPKSLLSIAGFLADYGRWGVALPAGEIEEAPIYNAMYRRDALLEIDDKLGELLSHGEGLRAEFESRGYRTYFEPAAQITHLNVDAVRPCFKERYLAGVLIGSQRADKWKWSRRILYICGSILIPLVLIKRMLPGLREASKRTPFPFTVYPVIVFLTYIRAFGEAVGYAGFGALKHEVAMDMYEIRKVDYLGRKNK